MDIKCGWLEIILGPMFSGKTEELLKKLEWYQYSGEPALLVKVSLDRRYSDTEVVTHSGLKKTAQVIEPTYDSFIKLEKEFDKVKIIGIDEFEFFEDSDKLVTEIVGLSNEKIVILAALNYNFRGEPWPIVEKIKSYVDHYTSKEAVCTYKDPFTGEICGNLATRTQRLINGNPAHRDSPTILVGGKEMYEARCKRHHIVP